MKTILVIDDDPLELDMLSTVLSRASYRCLFAEDGETGFNRAVFARPDLILLDVVMPGIDGYETCRRLRDHPRTEHIPILFKTCLRSADAIIKGIRSGIDDFICKPCDHDELVMRIAAKINITRKDSITAMKSALNLP